MLPLALHGAGKVCRKLLRHQCRSDALYVNAHPVLEAAAAQQEMAIFACRASETDINSFFERHRLSRVHVHCLPEDVGILATSMTNGNVRITDHLAQTYLLNPCKACVALFVV